MSDYSRNDSQRRPAGGSWVIMAWVLPLAIAIGLTVATAGFGAITIAIAIIIGLVATVLHFAGRGR